MNFNINKTFANGEYVMNEIRSFGRTMFSVNMIGNYSSNQKTETINTIHNFIKNGKRKDIMEIIKTATSIKHMLGLIESAFMTKHIKVRKQKPRKIKIKVGKKVTDIALDKFYII